MVHDITLDKASLVSLWVEAILYGAYAVLFGLCVYVLFKRKAGGAVNKPFLITAIVMFIINTAHIIIALIRGFHAFLGDEGNSNPEIDYYAQTWLPLDIIRQVLTVTTSFVADCMVAYRCYIVWGYQWKIIIVPVLLLVATTVAAFVSVYNFSQLKPGQPFLNQTNIQWGYAAFILWVVMIITFTLLISYRLRSIARQTEKYLGREYSSRYDYSMAVILESGVIYAISVLVLLLLCTVRSVFQAVAYDAISQITGITATLIIVRLGLGSITHGVSTDEYGSRGASGASANHKGSRRVSILNVSIHASGSELESMGPVDDKNV